jgi:preprotein translocase subunit YajC
VSPALPIFVIGLVFFVMAIEAHRRADRTLSRKRREQLRSIAVGYFVLTIVVEVLCTGVALVA